MTEEIITESREVERWKPINEYQKKIEKEMTDLVNRWEKTSLLKEINDPYVKGQMAIMLENQRLINEVSSDSVDLAQFKRISIPMVRRVFAPNAWIAWDIISVQTMIGPTAWVFSLHKPEETAACTKRIKSTFNMPAYDDIRKQHNLDEEAEQVAVLSSAICDEFNGEIIADLKNNCLVLEDTQFKGGESLWQAVQALCDKVKEATGFTPNWIATNDSLAKELKSLDIFEAFDPGSPYRTRLNLSIRRTGSVGGMKLIECKYDLADDILVGYKGEGPHDSSYAWMPYVPFTRTPVVLDPDTFAPRAGLLTRYGKRLCVNGAKFFARTVVKGHEPVIEKQEEAVGPLDAGEIISES